MHMMGPNLHLDILMGRDERLDYADVFGGEYLPSLQYHYLMTIYRCGDVACYWNPRSNGEEVEDVMFFATSNLLAHSTTLYLFRSYPEVSFNAIQKSRK